MVRFLSGPKNFSRGVFFCQRESQVGSIGKLTACLIWPVRNSHSWRVSMIKRFSGPFWYFFQSSSVFIRLYPPVLDSATTSAQDASLGVTARLETHKELIVRQITINAMKFFLIIFKLSSLNYYSPDITGNPMARQSITPSSRRTAWYPFLFNNSTASTERTQ